MAGADPMTIMLGYVPMVMVALLTAALILTGIAYFKHEGPGSQVSSEIVEDEKLKVDYLKALMPIVPVFLLVLTNERVAILPFSINVQQAMVICTIAAFFIVRKDYAGYVKEFFKGVGSSYGSIIGIIAAAAAMFTKGMQVIGLTDALIDVMKNSQNVAQLGAGFGPFILAVLCGSGNAATLAFNGAVTPFAEQFGFTLIDMGTVAQITGQIGRSMSPVAGVAIICARMAGVNPMELTKRNAVPTVAAAIVVMLTLM